MKKKEVYTVVGKHAIGLADACPPTLAGIFALSTNIAQKLFGVMSDIETFIS